MKLFFLCLLALLFTGCFDKTHVNPCDNTKLMLSYENDLCNVSFNFAYNYLEKRKEIFVWTEVDWLLTHSINKLDSSNLDSLTLREKEQIWLGMSNFSEDFKRIGTPHQTGISEYYTWDYDGEKNFMISETQEISIIINPNGETLGSVSVDILEN